MATIDDIPLIPLDVLLGNPEKSGPFISPDGSLLAYTAPVDGVMNVFVGKVGSDDFVPVTTDRDRGVRIYLWTYDSRGILYLQDFGGDENWHLFYTDIASHETVDLTPLEKAQVRIALYDRRHPNDVILEINARDPSLHDVYRLDLTTRDLTMIEENRDNFAAFLIDHDLRVRVAMRTLDDCSEELLLKSASGEWTVALRRSHEDAISNWAIGFTDDPDILLLLEMEGVDTNRLLRWNVATGKRDVLAHDDSYDIAYTVHHPVTHEVQAAVVAKARREWIVLDPGITADVAYLEQAHRGDIHIVSRDTADRTWVVSYNRDNGPISFYLYSRDDRRLTFLFDNRPVLNDYTLAECDPVSFASRDGLTIHGYATFPPGVERTSLPTVLYVHGGPWGRDMWCHDVVAQWLANRGYAVLQVNFRGSTGYGKAFVNAGDLEWGGKMQDDLTDAVRWAVSEGWADPTRVAIYGGSYGGYAALAGAAFTPDLYCCAVDIVGPSNLITLIRTIPPYWKPEISVFLRRVGDPDTQEEFLKSRSPLFHADKIRIPMLIAQGANDPRVKQAESDQIVDAMKRNGVDYEYLLFDDEGHGFAKPQNRLRFHRAAEKFLAKHLGGRCEAEPGS